MSKITNLLNQVYEPFMAIIAYRTTDSREQSFYLEQHKISKNDGSLGVGFPLRQKTITNLFDALSRTNKLETKNLFGIGSLRFVSYSLQRVLKYQMEK